MPISLMSSSVQHDNTHAPAARLQASDASAKIATPQSQTKADSPKQLAQAVNQVNESFSKNGQNLYAALEQDKKSGVDVVKVFDKTSKEVISQFPVKEIVAMAQAMSQSQTKGQMVHVRA